MDNLISNFRKIITEITGDNNTLHQVTDKPPNVIYYNDEYFSAVAGDISFHHIPNTDMLLIVDGNGVNYLIEDKKNRFATFLLHSITMIDQYDQLLCLKFTSNDSSGDYGLLTDISISADHPIVSCDRSVNSSKSLQTYRRPDDVRMCRMRFDTITTREYRNLWIGKLKIRVSVPDLHSSKYNILVNLYPSRENGYFSVSKAYIKYNNKYNLVSDVEYDGKPRTFMQALADRFGFCMKYDESTFISARRCLSGVYDNLDTLLQKT